MRGVTWEDRKIRNEYVRGCIRVVSIVKNMRENRFGWFDHVMRRFRNGKNGYGNEYWRKRGRGKQKKKWLDAVEYDIMRTAGMWVEDVEDRVK